MLTTKEKRHEYYIKNKEKIHAQNKAWELSHPEARKIIRDRYVNTARNKEKRRIYWLENKRVITSRRLERKFNLSLEVYEEKFKLQRLCGICKKDLLPGKASHLDHCHLTGKIREFLCETCNKGLGLFYDDPILLNNAIKYINKYKEIESGPNPNRCY